MIFQNLIDDVYKRYYADSKSWEVNKYNSQDLLKYIGVNTNITKINSKVIDKLISELKIKGNTNNTINRKLALLSKCMTYAFDRELITKKPIIEKLKCHSTSKQIIDEMQEVEILHYFAMRDTIIKAFCIIGLDTGMRLSEILDITIDSCDFKNKMIRVYENKADKPRSIPMTKRVYRTLKSLDTELFNNLNKNKLEYEWSMMLRKTGLKDITIHSMRHSYITRLIQCNTNIVVVKELAGHKTISVTMGYTHIHNEQLVEAVNRLEASLV